MQQTTPTTPTTTTTSTLSAPPPPDDPMPPSDTPTWKDGLQLVRARSSVANRFGPPADKSVATDSLRRSVSARRPPAFGATATAAVGDVHSKIHDILNAAMYADAGDEGAAPEKAQPEDDDCHAAKKKGKMAKAWKKLFHVKSKKHRGSSDE